MNEQVLDTLANVAITLAGFSGLVVVFRASGAHTWSATELRVLWFLIGDSFLVGRSLTCGDNLQPSTRIKRINELHSIKCYWTNIRERH